MILEFIVSGKSSDYVFNVFLAQLLMAVQNNFLLIWLIAALGKKIASFTKSTGDDKFWEWVLAILSKFRPTPKGVSPKVAVALHKSVNKSISVKKPFPGKKMFTKQKKPDRY